MASFSCFKKEIAELLRAEFEPGASALDVGACDGKYSDLLGGYFRMDAVEIYKPNADRLLTKYLHVYNVNILGFEFYRYDLIIMGDVLEHLSVEDAQATIRYAYPRCTELMIAVPYLYVQGPAYDNTYEVHLQADLTHELFMQRYPGFKRVFGSTEYGYYLKDNAK